MPISFFLSLLPFPLSLLSPLLKRDADARLRRRVHPDGRPSTRLERAFARFGAHVAHNQIRVLLICCVVMTSLAMPAFAIHYQTITTTPSSFSLRPDSLFNTPLLRPLFSSSSEGRPLPSPAPVALGPFEDDPFFRVSQVQAPTLSPFLRVRTIWISDVGRLSNSSVSEELGLEDFESALGRAALEFAGASCSPVDAEGLWEVYRCFSRDQEASLGETQWEERLKSVAGPDALVWSYSAEPAHDLLVEDLSLTWDPAARSTSYMRHSRIPVLAVPIPIVLLYAFLLLWTFRSLSAVTQVHSRFGLAFTYVTELAASTTCSGSVCVIMGWKLAGVPWFLLPFVISVIGVENMFHVTRAVVSTPIDLPISERLSRGLASAGPTITFTTITDILLLTLFGAVAGEKVAPVREFCTFATIVLVADWFLIFTFFATVISIDMQRLELADVLSQRTIPGHPVSPTTPPEPSSAAVPAQRPRRRKRPKSGKSSSEVLAAGFQAILRARTARNGSLGFLMVLLMIVWNYARISSYLPAMDLAAASISTELSSPSIIAFPSSFNHATPSSRKLWDMLADMDSPGMLHLSVFPPVAIILPSASSSLSSPSELVASLSPRPSRSFHHDLGPALWLSKVVLLPIAVSTGILYALLLWLLKDAELLEAQRDRLAVGEEWDEDDPLSGRLAHPPTLERAAGLHVTDVSLLATSSDGEVVLSASFDGTAKVWRRADPTQATSLFSTSTDPSYGYPSLLALDSHGSFCAVAFPSGLVVVWPLFEGHPSAALPLSFSSSSSSSAPSSFHNSLGSSSILDLSFLHDSRSSILVVLKQDGTLVEYDCEERSMRSSSLSSSPPTCVSCLWKNGRMDVAEVAVVASSGHISLYRREGPGVWPQRTNLDFRGRSALVSKVFSASVHGLDGSPLDLLALATDDGQVSLWDVSADTPTEVVGSIEVHSKITKIRVVQTPEPCQCPRCAQALDGFILAMSTSHSILLFRILPRSSSFSCACAPIRRSATFSDRSSLDIPLANGQVNGGRARSLSIVTGPSPKTPLKRLPTSSSATSLSATPDYPIAGHGVHSRRLSTQRRSDVDELTPALSADCGESYSPGPSPSRHGLGVRTSSESTSHFSPSPFVSASLGAIPLIRGDWELSTSSQSSGPRSLLVGFSKASPSSLSSVCEDYSAPPLSPNPSTSASKWRYFQVDLLRPCIGPDLAIHSVPLASLLPPTYSLPKTSSDVLLGPSFPTNLEVDEVSPGASLRRRREERALRFASTPSPSSSSSARGKGRISSSYVAGPSPSLSHTSVRPVQLAGDGGILAGEGNGVLALRFWRSQGPGVDGEEEGGADSSFGAGWNAAAGSEKGSVRRRSAVAATPGSRSPEGPSS